MSNIIYIPDPPGLMKTGGLHPTAVTLPLELTSKIGWQLIYVPAVVVLIVGYVVWTMWSLWQVNALYADPYAAVPPMVWLAFLFFLLRGAIIESSKAIAHQFTHRGPTLRVDDEGAGFRQFNKRVFSLRWADVMSAKIGFAAINPATSYVANAIELTLSYSVPGRRYAYRVSPTWGKPTLP